MNKKPKLSRTRQPHCENRKNITKSHAIQPSPWPGRGLPHKPRPPCGPELCTELKQKQKPTNTTACPWLSQHAMASPWFVSVLHYLLNSCYGGSKLLCSLAPMILNIAIPMLVATHTHLRLTLVPQCYSFLRRSSTHIQHHQLDFHKRKWFLKTCIFSKHSC